MVVIGELCSWQELVPVVLLVIGEDADELFELLVDVLCLTIGLQVVSSGGGRFDPYKTPKFSGELPNELWASVRDVLPQHAIVPPDVLVVEPGGSDRVDLGVAFYEMGTLA